MLIQKNLTNYKIRKSLEKVDTDSSSCYNHKQSYMKRESFEKKSTCHGRLKEPCLLKMGNENEMEDGLRAE